MNTKYLYGLIVLAFLAITGCVKLDTLPEGDTVTSSQKEEILSLSPAMAEAGVNAIFAKFTQYEPNADAVGRKRHDDYGFPSIMLNTDHNGYDLVSSDVGYNWNGDDLDYSDRDYTSAKSQINWNDLYSIIFTANNVIATIPVDAKDPQLQYYLAQGLASRAFSYWVLAQLYQFNYVGHQTDPCVPLITDENSDAVAIDGSARATVQEIYDQILSDINTAKTLLKSAEDNGVVRADKRYISLAVAYGISARVNLTMQNWSDAATDADAAIAASDATPASIADVSVPYFSTVDDNDWMWGIIITITDDVSTSGIVNWISHMGSLNWGYANYSGGKQINKSLWESIPTTDARKGWWVDDNMYSPNLNADELAFMSDTYTPYTQVKFAPYNNELAGTTNANDVPLMRIEEMYLIKAEAEAMSGGNGKATLESFVQTYRDPSYVCTNPDVQDAVFQQRRIEFWGEGLNWFDIMRLNKGVDRRGAGFEAPMVFNIPAGDNTLLWRIPEAEIQANVGLSESDNNPAMPSPSPVPDNK